MTEEINPHFDTWLFSFCPHDRLNVLHSTSLVSITFKGLLWYTFLALSLYYGNTVHQRASKNQFQGIITVALHCEYESASLKHNAQTERVVNSKSIAYEVDGIFS